VGVVVVSRIWRGERITDLVRVAFGNRWVSTVIPSESGSGTDSGWEPTASYGQS